LKIKEELWSARGRCSTLELREATRGSMMVLPLRNLSYISRIVGKDLMYQEYPMKILDTSEKITWNNRYKMCKVQQSNHTEEEATWEKEDQLKVEFADIFSNLSKSWG
jgi:hypothetical protein